VIGLIPALTPSEDLAVVLQAAGVGALIGTALAARLRARNPEADAFVPTAAWTLLLAGIAGLGVLTKRLGLW
jgi:hypothetical protein